jgi:hypothetical protein
MPALLLRLYPAWWRARHGDEFAALLDEHGDGEVSLDDRRRAAIAAALWALAAFVPIAGIFARLPENGRLTSALAGHPLVWPAAAVLVLGVVAIGLVAFCVAFMVAVPAIGAARRSHRRDLRRSVALISAAPLLIVCAQALLGVSYVGLTPAQRHGLAPTPGGREVVLVVWAAMLAIAIVAATKGISVLVRHSSLGAVSAEGFSTIAAALVVSIAVALVGVAGWGVTMRIAAPAAFDTKTTVVWVAMLGLGPLPLIVAGRRCGAAALPTNRG